MSTTTILTKQYNVVNGTSYHIETPDKVISVLEKARKDRTEVLIRLGDAETGRDWMEENDCCGTIGRSTGTSKIPLLVPKNENGGPALLDHCIVKIIRQSDDKVLYIHPKYNRPEITIGKPDMEGYFATGYFDGKLVARFQTAAEKNRWLTIMDN